MRQLESIAKKAVWASLVLCSVMLWTEPVMAAKPQPVRQVLWYTRPATNWMTEALPVGNGRIGAMIFGGLPVERIQFNDKTLWTGSTTERGAYQNFGNSAADNYKIMARIDWNISKNHKLMVRYNDVKSQDDNLVSGASTPGGVRLNNAGRNSINSISFANTGYKQENRVRSITAELNSVFSPKVSNKLLASFTNINDTRKTDGDLFPFVDIMRLGSDGKTYEGYMSFGTTAY